MINLKRMLKEIQNVKIQIGIEEKIIEKNTAFFMKKYKVKNIDEAKKVLNEIDLKLKKIHKRIDKLTKEAEKILERTR